MPYADNNGVKIHYKVEGTGTPIVFCYGLFNVLPVWYDFGYVDALKDQYQLILMDVRGHGQSDKPHEIEAYALETLVGDITAILDAEGIDKAHYYGFSLGGYIGWGIAKYAPERFHSLMIAAFAPDQPDGDSAITRATQLGNFFQQGSELCTNVFRNAFGEFWQPGWGAIYAEADLKAIEAIASRWEEISREETLSNLTLPCLLVCGDHDSALEGMQQVSEIIPDGQLVVMPGLRHPQLLACSDLVTPHITRFLDRVE